MARMQQIGVLALTAVAIWSVLIVPEDGERAMAQFLHLLAGVAFVWWVWRHEKKERLVAAFVFSMVVQAVLALWQFGAQEVVASTLLGIAAQDPATLGVPVIESEGGRWLRAFGGFQHPNILGAWLAAGALLTLPKAIGKKRAWMWSGVLAVILAGLLVTFSRSASLGLFVGGIAWLITLGVRREFGSYKRFVLPAVAAITIVVLAFVSFGPLLQTRVGFDARLEKKSVSERVQTIEDGYDVFLSQSVFGTGLGHATHALKEIKPDLPGYLLQPPHAALFALLVEVGTLGILLVGFAAYALLVPFCRKREALHSVLPMFALLFVVSFFDHFLWTLWPGIALVAVAFSLALADCKPRNEAV